MLAVISPAKRMSFDPLEQDLTATEPEFLEDSQELVARARKLTANKLKALMKISDKLADLNVQRFKEFSTPFTRENAKQAALAFAGDTYIGLDAANLNKADWTFAQEHLAILSGLYGLLRPLDLIQAYRLEMGTRLDTDRGRDLYTFWGESLTEGINGRTKRHKDRAVVNLASREYFKAVQPDLLAEGVVTPLFKDVRGGKVKMIALLAKRARGSMAGWMIRNRVERREDLKAFDLGGYGFEDSLSSDSEWVFLREGD